MRLVDYFRESKNTDTKIKTNYIDSFLRQYLIAYNILQNVNSSSIKIMNHQSEHIIVDTSNLGNVYDVDYMLTVALNVLKTNYRF